MFHSLANRLRRFWHGLALEVWHDPAYRLPLPGLEAATGFEPRRADFVAWYLLGSHAVQRKNIRAPRRATYAEMARVHPHSFLDAMSRPQELARVFSMDPGQLPVDELIRSIRLSVGGTIDAAKSMLAPGGPRLGRRALNLLGGFHHAGPTSAGGFCAVNDVAVAIAAVRADGFRGRIAVLDLDAHPPDGTAACLRDDEQVWMGSISGAEWGAYPRQVDEIVIPGAGDELYLSSLADLLARMPRDCGLAFVLAGGDVLAGDTLGKLALTLAGVRQRDLRVSDALLHVPSVWLPAGGYGPNAWCALAGTGLALSVASDVPIPTRYDPLGARFAAVSRKLAREALGHGDDFSMDDVAQDLGIRSPGTQLVLGLYSAAGIEAALEHYGLLQQLARLGYGPFRVEIARGSPGDRVRLFGGDSDGVEHMLVEAALEKRVIDGSPVLYVHWLTMRNPRAKFSAHRPRLPGQEVPGLGLAREMSELLARMALRLDLDGVAFRPAGFHTAVGGRVQELRFTDPARQGRFEALDRDLAQLSLLDATIAIASGNVLMNGQPYTWEPDEMVRWLKAHPTAGAEAIKAERERVHFTLVHPVSAAAQFDGKSAP